MIVLVVVSGVDSDADFGGGTEFGVLLMLPITWVGNLTYIRKHSTAVS